jgi:hypothetical protein
VSQRVGLVTPDHWEEELKGSAGEPQGSRAGSGDKAPSASEQGDETEFEFT